MSELLTPAEMAQRLRVSKRTLQLWTREGRIPSVRISAKVIRYDPETVTSALTERAAGEEGVRNGK